MTCPICKKSGARRSHRQTLVDHLISAFGVYPWRCHHCQGRFHSRLMPLSHFVYAHCPICGNADLRRISGELVSTPLGVLWRFLNIPAFRCDPCRYKYFSVLPLREAEEHMYTHSSAD